MSNFLPEPQVLEHLRVVSRYRRVIAAVSLGLAALVYLLQSAQTPTYAATATVRFVVPEITSGGSVARESADVLAVTYVETATGPAWAQRVVAAGGAVDPGDVAGRLVVAQQTTPGFLGVRATAPTAAGAASLANAGAAALVALMRDDQQGAVQRGTEPLAAQLADITAQLGTLGLDDVTKRSLADRRAALQQAIAERVQLTRVTVLDPVPAVAPSAPISPRPVRNALAALLAAAVLTIEGLALYRYVRGLLPLGDVEGSLHRLLGDVPVVTIDTTDASRSDAIVPFVLEHLSAHRTITVLQRGGQPDTTAATEIADAIARSGSRVLLADTDVRSPTLHRRVGIPLSPGLVEVTSGQRKLGRSVRQLPGAIGGVAVLSAGALADATPLGVLGDDRVRALLRRSGADNAVLVSTSAVPLDDALFVAHRFPDAVVLAVDAERVRRGEIAEAARAVRAVGGNVTGAVCVRGRGPQLHWRERVGDIARRLQRAGVSVKPAPSTADVDAEGARPRPTAAPRSSSAGN